ARLPSLSLSYERYRLFFFFFQAEDGIRDFHVTGVQTCALPIYRGGVDVDDPFRSDPRRTDIDLVLVDRGAPLAHLLDQRQQRARSEERRVGKEGRSRWWQTQ